MKNFQYFERELEGYLKFCLSVFFLHFFVVSVWHFVLPGKIFKILNKRLSAFGKLHLAPLNNLSPDESAREKLACEALMERTHLYDGRLTSYLGFHEFRFWSHILPS